jgi:hypothetical protein
MILALAVACPMTLKWQRRKAQSGQGRERKQAKIYEAVSDVIQYNDTDD